MNYIGMLNEYCQKQKTPLPVYTDEGSLGNRFRMYVTVIVCDQELEFHGIGLTKKEAKYKCAQKAFEHITADMNATSPPALPRDIIKTYLHAIVDGLELDDLVDKINAMRA